MRTYFLFFVAANACVSGQWLNHQTAGVPRKPDGSPNLSAPAPKTPMGKPDLSGLWRLGFGPYSFDATKDLTRSDISTWAADLQKQNMETEGKDRWSVTCLPGGPALGIDRQIAKIVQTPELIVILYEDLSYRQIFLDGRELPGDPNPDWMGYSVGRWEGDTLVVESAGFNDRTWLDYGGHPHTEALRITELFRRTDLGHIDLQIKYSDPKAYAKPWIIRTNLALAADTELIEYVCAENERDRPHMVGRASEDLKNAVIVAPELLAKYAGTYEFVAPGDRAPMPMRVDLSGTQLTVDFNGNSPLTAVSDTVFTVSAGAQIQFVMDGQGSVTHLVLSTVEGEIKAPRKK